MLKLNSKIFSLNLILIITNILCEKFTLENFTLSSNTVDNFRRFIYMNTTVHNETTEQTGFSYNLTIYHNISNNLNTPFQNKNESFHIYILKADVIPHSDLLNNPSVCCSDEGGVICDDYFESNNPKSKEEEYKLLRTHSIYYKDIDLTSSVINITEEKNFIVEGIFYSMFLLCEPLKISRDTGNIPSNNASYTGEYYDDYSDKILLKGEFTFYNSFGYLSAEEYYTVDIYLLTSAYYFVLSLYWVYKIIILGDGLNFYTKAVTILLPVVILEKMMDLQVYSEINSSGELNVAFTIIGTICYVIDSIIIRVIFYAISIGFGFSVWSYAEVSKKKVFNFTLLMIGYIASIILHSILHSRYMFHDTSLAYLILSLFFMYLTSLYLMYKIFKGINKQKTYLSRTKSYDTINSNGLSFYLSILKTIKICFGLLIFYIFFQCLLRLFQNYEFSWKCKWVIDVLAEIIQGVMYTTVIILLQKNAGVINNHQSSPAKGYIRQLEESSDPHRSTYSLEQI